MKKIIFKYAIPVMLLIILPFYSLAQMGSPPEPENVLIEESLTGKWKFEAPDAPEGSTKGDIEIKPDMVIMRFDNVVEFPSTWVKFRNDSIIYQTDFAAATVLFSLKIIDRKHMSGKAVWEDGESPFILVKFLGAIL